MASYDKSYSADYTTKVQQALQQMGANLGGAGVDGKWGSNTQNAYNQYKSQVDSLLSGNSNNTGSNQNNGTWTGFYDGGNSNANNYGGGTGTPYSGMSNGYSISSSVPNYSVPQIGYSGRSLSELMSEATGLIGGQYDAQILAAGQGYGASQKSLEKSYTSARNTTNDSAVSRGMGRSSYLTDAIANVGLQEVAANDQLTSNYNDTLSGLQSSKASAISSYVQSLQRQQEEMMYNAALQQAQLQYQYDALNQGAQMSAYQNALSKAGSGSSGGDRSSNSPNAAANRDIFAADKTSTGKGEGGFDPYKLTYYRYKS